LNIGVDKAQLFFNPFQIGPIREYIQNNFPVGTQFPNKFLEGVGNDVYSGIVLVWKPRI